LFRENTAQGEPGATDGAKEVAAFGEFSDLEGLTEAQIAELLATRAFQKTNLKIAAHLSLSEAQHTVECRILDCLEWHLLTECCN